MNETGKRQTRAYWLRILAATFIFIVFVAIINVAAHGAFLRPGEDVRVANDPPHDIGGRGAVARPDTYTSAIVCRHGNVARRHYAKPPDRRRIKLSIPEPRAPTGSGIATTLVKQICFDRHVEQIWARVVRPSVTDGGLSPCQCSPLAAARGFIRPRFAAVAAASVAGDKPSGGDVGLVEADVATLKPRQPPSDDRFRHKIIYSSNFRETTAHHAG